MFIKNFFIRTADRFFCTIGAFFFSQIPNFIHEYQTRLSGHVDELSFQLTEIRKMALASQMTLNEYIDKFLQSSDKEFHSQGIFLQHIYERYETFVTHLQKLQECSIFYKPIYLFTHLNISIAWSTTKNFSTSLPLNLEGLYYIILGLFFGSGIFWFIRRIVGKLKFNKENHELKHKRGGLQGNLERVQPTDSI